MLNLWQALSQANRAPRRSADWIVVLLSVLPPCALMILMALHVYPFLLAESGSQFQAKLVLGVVMLPLAIFLYALSKLLLFRLVDRFYGRP